MRAIAEGLFTEDVPPRLIGGRNRHTGRIVFPCPENGDFEPHPLSSEGSLWSYTIQRFRPKSPPYEGSEDFRPWALGYVALPGETIVESKSLKLFLGSFRNHCGFHEDVTVGIGQRLFDEMAPRWLRIGGYWYPRGGIPIDVFWQSGPVPEGLWVPEQGVQNYRGRG